MCDTCPAHIPGPGEVAGAGLSALVGATLTKPGRRVMFWGFAVPMLPFAVWGVFGWWTIALVAVAAALTGAGLAYMKAMSRHMVINAPASLRAALPAAAPRRAVALPRNLAIAGGRKALPAATKVLPAPVLTGTVVPAPARRAAR